MKSWGTVMAVAAVALAVGSGCGATRGDSSRAAADKPFAAASPGWKWQSYAALHFQVPISWLRGSPDQWCVDGGVKTPAVLVPETSQSLALCTHPFQTYGARIVRAEDVTPDMADPDRTAAQAMGKYGDGVPGRAYPEGAAVQVVTRGDWAVAIVAPDQATLEGIVGSVVSSTTDPVGCASASERPDDNGGSPVIDDLDPDAAVTLCHYTGSGDLRLGEQLDDDDSRAAVKAFAAAEPGAGAGDCETAELDYLQPWVEVRVGDDAFFAALGTPNGCLGVGLTDGTETRSLTTDTLYWLMAPGLDWSFDQQTPLPKERRKY